MPFHIGSENQDYYMRYVTCPRCGGSGEIGIFNKKKCPVCGGTGHVEEAEHISDRWDRYNPNGN